MNVAQAIRIRFQLTRRMRARTRVFPEPSGMEQVFVGTARSIFSGPVRVGTDGDFISLPAGSSKIDLARRF